jgi:hypothetical protein
LAGVVDFLDDHVLIVLVEDAFDLWVEVAWGDDEGARSI